MKSNRRKATSLVSRISKILKIDTSTIYYFITIDLERILSKKNQQKAGQEEFIWVLEQMN